VKIVIVPPPLLLQKSRSADVVSSADIAGAAFLGEANNAEKADGLPEHVLVKSHSMTVKNTTSQCIV
jgi:hypothetical protein